jgi:nucleoid-associated protein Lsr2
MATQTITTLVDDIDGGKAEETVSFALDGMNYEIDLGKRNAARLRSEIQGYIEYARAVRNTSNGRRRGRRSSGGAQPARRDREQIQAIRGWGIANGYEVSSRGRIPATLQEAYDAAQ